MDDCEHFWVNISSKRQRAWQCSHCGELRLDDPTQKREWQGLTDEEIKDILDCGRPDLVNIKKAEAKLKEKNNGSI